MEVLLNRNVTSNRLDFHLITLVSYKSQNKIMRNYNGLVYKEFPRGLKVKDLTPAHGEGSIGWEHIVQDTNGEHWVYLDAPVHDPGFSEEVVILLRHTADNGYEVRLNVIPNHLKLEDHRYEPPDPTLWVRVKVLGTAFAYLA